MPQQFFVQGVHGIHLNTPIDHFYWASEGDTPYASEGDTPYATLDCVAGKNGTEYWVSSGTYDENKPTQKFDKASDALIAFAALLKEKGF